jgi:hypothetical protein
MGRKIVVSLAKEKERTEGVVVLVVRVIVGVSKEKRINSETSFCYLIVS